MLRFETSRVACVIGTALAFALAFGCGSDDGGTSGTGLALRDPLDLIDDVDGPLRLLLFSADAYTCETATGMVTPSPAEGRTDAVPDAVVDLTFDAAAGQEVQVIAGSYTILVRGWGTDVVSGRTNVIIASGCSTQEIGAGETRAVEVELHPVFGEGVCGDGTLSPDEQCEDGNVTAGDGCDADCRSEPFIVSRRPLMEVAAEITPAVAWAERARVMATYDAALGATRDIRAMMLAEDGTFISTPTALAVDGDVESLAGVQATPDVGLGGGRYGVAYADFSGASEMGDVRVRFLDGDRSPLGAAVVATGASTGRQTDPAIALGTDGTAFVAFADTQSATGLSGVVFAAGATTPAGAAFPIGQGTTGGGQVAVAAITGGFLIAFSAGGDVYYQRFGADGSATDAMAGLVADGADASGEQIEPDVAALDDGRAIIVYHDDTRGIRGRTLDAAGALGASVVDVSMSAAGAAAPSVAAGRERFVVVWQAGTAIRARMLDSAGAPALNREPTPSTDELVIATGPVSAPSVAAGGTADEPMFLTLWQDTSTDPMSDVRGRLIALP